MKKLLILGTRGIPACHGGFETFAEFLSVYLVRHGWDVTVYCQIENGEPSEDFWNGVRRVKLQVSTKGALGTVFFDFKAVLRSLLEKDAIVLTLGYNTAIFLFLYRIFGVVNLINMDGIEWRRDKWRWYEKIWLWCNERAGCIFANHLVADHPEIKNHLETMISGKSTMIPYGARCVVSADVMLLSKFGVEEGEFFCLIARPEPENSIFEIVKAFSRKKRGVKLLVFGHYSPADNEFHRKVVDCASEEVLFPGAVYDKNLIDAVRFYAKAYIHGHRVGGTNPSLVEALGAGSAILAHDNKFNRWVAGSGALYFNDEESCDRAINALLSSENKISQLRAAARSQFERGFTWEIVLDQYENLLSSWDRR